MKPIKVLILTAPYGNGHYQVAKVLKDSFESRGIITVEKDFFEEYDRMVYGPSKWVYSQCFSPGWAQFYYFCYKSVDLFFHENIWNFNAKKFRKFRQMMDQEEFDAIINTFPIAASYSWAHDRKYRNIYTVVTDYSAHRKWIDHNNYRYFVGDKVLFDYFGPRRPSELSKLEVTGIPIREQFYKDHDIAQLKVKYDIPENVDVFTILMGAQGVFPELVDWVINQATNNPDAIYNVMVGRNEESKNNVEAAKLANLRAIGYTDDVAEYYSISDLVISKPGGITMSELMQTGTPTLIYKPLAGQELNNAKFFEAEGIALVAKNLNKLTEVMAEVTNDHSIIDGLKENLKRHHKENASEKIADIILDDILEIRQSKQK